MRRRYQTMPLLNLLLADTKGSAIGGERDVSHILSVDEAEKLGIEHDLGRNLIVYGLGRDR